MKYNHRKIESKWQKIWERQKLYETPDEKKGTENFYTLVEFPYPSGNLHVGHWYAFSVPDIFARYMRMQGLNVMFPIGFDAFGLPAENAAIQRGINPRKWTYDNIEYMKKQLQTMGASFDWSREVITCDPEYYKWTQWIFLQFFKKGLAYQAETYVNWCPSCKTVLANEQVINGRCERCETEVEQRKMKQWMLRITDYAEKLLEGLEKLKDWPEEIKEAQRNWIGRSEGAEIDFRLQIADFRIKRFVLLHGKRSSPKPTPLSGFIPWLEKRLKSAGYEVQVPLLPNPYEPNDLEQAEYVRKNCTLDQNTAVLGHSFGGVVALRLLEQGIKVNQVILVGTPFSGEFLDGKERSTVSEALQRGFDFAKIKKNAENFIALYDKKDYVVPTRDGEAFAKNLNADFRPVEAEDAHFSNKEEPTVLDACLPSIKVFTTRPDTIFGATYMVVAPEHPLIDSLLKTTPSSSPPPKSEGEKERGRPALAIENAEEVKKYIQMAQRKTELERLSEGRQKTGVELKGVKAINPATREEIPIWIADYVIMGYGTGAIMAVPAHDERDYEFATKYKLPIKKIILPPELGAIPRNIEDIAAGYKEDIRVEAECWTGDGTMTNSGKFNGMDSERAKWEITGFVNGTKKVQYKMRDWVISRQRYWGVPIPVIHCEMCEKSYPVPEKDLPVELPELKDFKPKGDGKSPLARAEDWVKVKCPTCGLPAQRETDTMDTFIDSSWYFLRYCDPKNKSEFAAQEKLRKWMPVDMYSGGAEHTTMHLLYSRFWIKAMYDLGLLPWNEPYVRRMNRGLILGPDGQKMSKSRGNVVDPDDYVKELGADTVRMYLAFIGPYNVVGAYPWDPKGIMGVRRFLEKTWRLFQISNFQFPISKKEEVERLLHKTIKKVGEDIESMKFNTGVSALMILLNKLSAPGGSASGGESLIATKAQLETFLKLLVPFAPHITEELWEQLGYKQSIHLENWPGYDEKLVREEFVNVAVQVNGKVRGTIRLSLDAPEQEARNKAEQNPRVQKYLTGEIKKIIYVPGKIINFVIDADKRGKD